MRTAFYTALFMLTVVVSGCTGSSFFEPTTLQNPENAMVYIYRPAATNPGKKPLTLSYPEIMVDGMSVGFLKYKEYLPLELAPGKRDFVVTGLTRDAKWELRDSSYKLKVEPGKSYFLRYRVEFNVDKMSIGTFKGQYLTGFSPIDETDAVYEIRHTSNGTPK
jgi:hypothetical protein